MAWMGLVLLAFNLIAGAMMPASAQAPIGQSGQQFYICTALGLKAIGPAADLDQGKAAGHGAQICAFCLPLMSGGLDSPAPVTVADADLTPTLAEYAPPAKSVPASSSRRGQTAPRAPPVS